MKKTIIIISAILLCAAHCFSQGTAINATGSRADTSAILDISSTTKGVLVPRMSKANKLAISSPANGLLIYQTDDTTGFWYYNSVKWVQAMGQAGSGGAQYSVFNGVTNCLDGLSSITWADMYPTAAASGYDINNCIAVSPLYYSNKVGWVITYNTESYNPCTHQNLPNCSYPAQGSNWNTVIATSYQSGYTRWPQRQISRIMCFQ